MKIFIKNLGIQLIIEFIFAFRINTSMVYDNNLHYFIIKYQINLRIIDDFAKFGIRYYKKRVVKKNILSYIIDQLLFLVLVLFVYSFVFLVFSLI